MKLREIISEKVDVSFWKEIDAKFNPEALEQVEEQEKRLRLLKKMSPVGTTVFDKPVNPQQIKFTNKPNAGEPKSPGYRGKTNARVKAGHISRETGEKLLNR